MHLKQITRPLGSVDPTQNYTSYTKDVSKTCGVFLFLQIPTLTVFRNIRYTKVRELQNIENLFCLNRIPGRYTLGGFP